MRQKTTTFAYCDQVPIVFSFPGAFLTEPDRPLNADSQISSSILIQEAHKRHRSQLDFPRRSAKGEIACPSPKPAEQRRWKGPRGAAVNMSSLS